MPELETEDYVKMFSIVPNLSTLNLRCAGQFKDEVLDYILERDITIHHLQLDAANLVSDSKWRDFLCKRGKYLESLKLSWLDYSMDDETVADLTKGCPNLKRLKLKKCFKIGEQSLNSIASLANLEHLSLRMIQPITCPYVVGLIKKVGSKLRTLSLEHFDQADDTVLKTIHNKCSKLVKFRFTENDYCTDAGFTTLFTNWGNPPLAFIDVNSNRDVDYTNPDGPTEPTGLASSGFKALMNHSRSRLERLDISSCRHITHEAFSEVFDGIKQYPFLKDINVSLLTKIDTPVVAGMFKSCPHLVKLTAFACFNVKDVVVPAGVALIGVPNAQDAIVQGGEYAGEMWGLQDSMGVGFGGDQSMAMHGSLSELQLVA